MNTIDREEAQTTTNTVPEESSLAKRTANDDADSLAWIEEERADLTQIHGSDVASRRSEPAQQQSRTLQQQIVLMILCSAVIPVGLGGWLAVNKIAMPNSSPAEAQAEHPETHSIYQWVEILILLSIGFINLGIGVWASRQLSSSIKQVTAKLTEAASGNLSVRVEPGNTNEFQELADSFNQLVANFNNTLQQQQLAAKANKLFGKIALTAQESVDRLQVYNTSVNGVRHILKADRVSIYRCNPDSSAVVVAESAADGYAIALSTLVEPVYFAESPEEWARYQQGKNSIIEDYNQLQLSTKQRKFVAKMQLKSTIVVPILGGNELTGLLAIHQCSHLREWQSWEVAFCAQTAQRLSLAIDQISTWNLQALELRRTNMLSQALQVNDLSESTGLLEEALELVRQEFDLDRVLAIGLSAPQSSQIVAMAVDPSYVPSDETMLEQYLQYEIDRDCEDDLPDRISNIYNLNEQGGLKADDIALLERLQIRARLVTPILFEDRVLGSLVGHMCAEDHKWTKAETDKFTTVADRIGLVLNRRKSIAQRAAKLAQQNLLSEISIQLRQSLDRDLIIAMALANIQQTFELDRAVFLTLNDSWETTIVAESLAPDQPSILGQTIDDTCLQKTHGAGYERGRITAIDDIYQAGLTDCHIQMLERLQVRSNLVLPVIINNKLFGLIIGHMCDAPRIWESDTIEVLGQIADQISLVLNQAQLFAQRENDARRSQIISNFTLQLRQSLRRQDILTTAVELVRYALDLDRAVIFELDANYNGKITAESVAEGKLSILNERIEDCCIKDAGYQHGKITSFPDIYQAGLTDCHIQMLESLQVRANLVVPITIDSHLFGLLIGHECQQPRAWQPEEINLFNQLATQLALALNQASLIEEREAAAKQSQLVSEITLKLRQSIDETEILNIALPEIRTALGLDRASMLVVDSNGQGEGTIVAESVAADEFSILGATISADHMFEILGKGYAEGSFIQLDSLETTDFSPELIANLAQIHIKSIVTTPIIVNNKFFGLFSGTMCRLPRQWQQSEIDLLLQLAAQVGVALNQGQLVRQLEIANFQQAGYAASQEAARQLLQKNAWDLLIQVDRISQGDLTIRAHVTEDEIGTIADSYNSTVESLRGLVGKVRNVSQQVVSTTNINEISVAELSIEALQQSEDISLALRRLQDMAGSIELVVNNALIAESAVMESAQLVKAGDAAMNSAVEGILTIRNTVAETAKKVKRLGESSQKISKVVNLISSFAAQTNLLALNASIEAARAGEEGRGFAVVAEEVRSLARQSAAATGEIENLVASIQAQTSEVVTAMEAGTEQVVIGTKLVDETRLSLDRITAIGTKIGELVESIAQAALLQSENSLQVTQSIDRVADISHKTSLRADNVQASFLELLTLAQELQKNVGQFKIE
ncbi:GAF domain-containing protein [Chamaesiphon minutus]|uniref:Methyl-accepting chemotaxis protein n=1 Tax=Chamaesiphon minutus (strain ATCC 27169 / PCC 6605) TaxID=1173020 RepID=K9UJ11_CHAP6|nr:GAF domain-containing protein [Chamaesiphon minutus]AFY94653.1 methyl-accepting chemotaxis protein [Chamaesiphon minutus PCC 6605]